MADKRKQTRRRLPPQAGTKPSHATPTIASERSPRGSWLSLLIFVPITLCLTTFLLWNQVQIARVILGGVPAHATVVALRHCDRATAGDLTLTFTDARGHSQTVIHSSYNGFCTNNIYRVGDDVSIRYLLDDPGTLMTQADIDWLPLSLVLFILGDITFLGGGMAAVYLLLLQPLAKHLRGPTQSD